MIASLPTEILRSLRLTLVIAAVTGLIYPFFITGIAQIVFPSQANGSLITKNGQVVGSTLIGQQFTKPEYFHGRPSATVNANTGSPQPYAADNSGGSNLGPSNKALTDRVSHDAATVRKENGLGPNAEVPVDLVTTDFSGLDPNISEASALLQVDRVAKARKLNPARVRALVEEHVQGRILGILGESHVNVLDLNLALDNRYQ
jgi:K+-transporting ATPase ATPase C chain